MNILWTVVVSLRGYVAYGSGFGVRVLGVNGRLHETRPVGCVRYCALIVT